MNIHRGGGGLAVRRRLCEGEGWKVVAAAREQGGGGRTAEVEGDGASQPAVSPAVRRNVGLRAGVSCVRRDASLLSWLGQPASLASFYFLPYTRFGQSSFETRDLTLSSLVPGPSEFYLHIIM